MTSMWMRMRMRMRITLKAALAICVAVTLVSVGATASATAMATVTAETTATSVGGGEFAGCPPACRCSTAMGKNITICQEIGLTGVPSGIGERTNFLDLSGNRIETLRDRQFGSLRLFSLETILLDGSGVRLVQSRAFGGLKWLKQLDLSNNSISSLDRFLFADNKLLEVINLSGNPIRTLGSFQFTALPMLKQLDLSKCALSVVEPEAFSNLLFVERLYLQNNSLSTLPADAFTWLRHLKELDLRANPWRCDCDVQSLVILLSIRRLYTRDLSCTYDADNKTNLWQHMENVDLDCVPRIESSVKENLLSLSERLHEMRQRFDVMDTSRKTQSSPSVETSLLPIAFVTVAAALSFLCLVSCYAKCRARNARNGGACFATARPWRRNTTGAGGLGRKSNHAEDDDFERACYSNFDDDCSDISLTVEL